MDVTCQTIAGMQLCLILSFYIEKTAAFCSLDHKAVLRIAKHWEIKGTLGLQVLRHHKIESSSLTKMNCAVTVAGNYSRTVGLN